MKNAEAISGRARWLLERERDMCAKVKSRKAGMTRFPKGCLRRVRMFIGRRGRKSGIRGALRFKIR